MANVTFLRVSQKSVYRCLNNMAALSLLPSTMDQNDYTVAEQELQDHILDIYGNRDNEDDMFRCETIHVNDTVIFWCCGKSLSCTKTL